MPSIAFDVPSFRKKRRVRTGQFWISVFPHPFWWDRGWISLSWTIRGRSVFSYSCGHVFRWDQKNAEWKGQFLLWMETYSYEIPLFNFYPKGLDSALSFLGLPFFQTLTKWFFATKKEPWVCAVSPQVSAANTLHGTSKSSHSKTARSKNPTFR